MYGAIPSLNLRDVVNDWSPMPEARLMHCDFKGLD